MDYKRWFKCERKKRHMSISAANKQIKRMIKNGVGNGLIVYECKYCCWFHIGHKSTNK